MSKLTLEIEQLAGHFPKTVLLVDGKPIAYISELKIRTSSASLAPKVELKVPSTSYESAKQMLAELPFCTLKRG